MLAENGLKPEEWKDTTEKWKGKKTSVSASLLV